MMKLPCLDCGKIHGQTEECLNKENRFIMTEINKRPLIGLGVIIVNPADKILLGLRKGSHGAGEWSLPGGHLEWNESFEECSRKGSYGWCMHTPGEYMHISVEHVHTTRLSMYTPP